jgi:hypothetical protein
MSNAPDIPANEPAPVLGPGKFYSAVHPFVVEGCRAYVTVNMRGDYAPFEVCLEVGMEESQLAGELFRSVGRTITAGLSHEVGFDQIVSELEATWLASTPSPGRGYTAAHVRVVQVLIGYVIRWLKSNFFRGEEGLRHLKEVATISTRS